jgi:hypothetical protein
MTAMDSLRRLRTDWIDAMVAPGVNIHPADNGYINPYRSSAW